VRNGSLAASAVAVSPAGAVPLIMAVMIHGDTKASPVGRDRAPADLAIGAGAIPSRSGPKAMSGRANPFQP
jgi:hypothetical protein